MIYTRNKLSFTNFSISFLSTLVPISLFFKSDFISSITSLATSDSSNDISSSNKISSMSFSFSSFSLRLFAALENALEVYQTFFAPGFELYCLH